MKLHLPALLFLLSAAPVIRVAIIKDVSNLTIQGAELRVHLPEAKPSSYYIASPSAVSPVENGFKVGSSFYLFPSIQISSENNQLLINEKAFAGKIEVQRSNNTITVLNSLPVEEYLVGLIPGEIPSNWPREAIKAQVVAARTYALFRQTQRKANSYDLEADMMDQVYLGSQGAKKDTALKPLIEATAGEVLWFLGYYPAYFHSCCGGQTELPKNVWGKKEDAKSVIDPFCEKGPYRNWELRLSSSQLLAILKNHGLEGSRLKKMEVERLDSSPRNAMLTIETDTMSLFLKATDLRRILGYDKLMSTWFELESKPNEIVFKGKGYGHGVGFCQWGAKQMAEAGADYKTILQFYYPKAVLRKAY